jgi:hypothetical protein
VAVDPNTHNELQLAIARENLRQAEREIKALGEKTAIIRKLVWELAQSTVPEALAAIPSTESGNLFAAPVKAVTLDAADLLRLVHPALVNKLRKLTAFQIGITDEQRERFLKRILETDTRDWVNDPRLAQLTRQLEDAQRETERLKTQIQEYQTQEVATQRSANEQTAANFALRREIAELRQQLKEIQSVRATASEPLSSSSAATVAAPELPAPSPAASPRTEPSDVSTPNPASAPKQYAKTPTEDSMPVLIAIMANNGWCERARIATAMIAPEYGLGVSDTNNGLINGAFQSAHSSGLIEEFTPSNECGVGRPTNLVRLTDKGRTYARNELKIDSAASELTRLLKQHDTIDHVSLILRVRQLFAEMYPIPITNIDLYPSPIPVGDGKRSEPDLDVVTNDGGGMHIECERHADPSPAAQRADKWHKAWVAGKNWLYIICPDATALSELTRDISRWYASHRGECHIRITSVQQAVGKIGPLKKKGENPTLSDFWVYSRDFEQ